MDAKTPDDEVAEEYGDYSRYINLPAPAVGSSKDVERTGVTYTVVGPGTIEDIDTQYTKLEGQDTGVPHVITKKGLTYALPNKNKPEPQTNQEDDDKYMNIDEIENQREPDYAAPDEDKVQQYNTYAQVVTDIGTFHFISRCAYYVRLDQKG